MRRRSQLRPGFSLIELLVVLVMAAVIMAGMMPSITRSLAHGRLQRASTVIASDLQLAYSLAARQRRPVRISIDSANRVIRVRDLASGRVYSERRFDRLSEYPLQRFIVTDTSRLIYPNGLGQAITMTLGAAGKTRVVTMTRAGQVRVQ